MTMYTWLKKAYIRLKSSFTPLSFFAPTNLDGMENGKEGSWKLIEWVLSPISLRI